MKIILWAFASGSFTAFGIRDLTTAHWFGAIVNCVAAFVAFRNAQRSLPGED